MWTDKTLKYYTLLRAQEKERSAANGVNARSGGTTYATHPHSLTKTDGDRHATWPPVATEAVFIDPSEGQACVVDPVAALDLAPTEIQKITALTLARRRMTDIHPNVLLFTNLESLALQNNCLRTVRNVVPPLSSRASSSSVPPQSGASGREVDACKGNSSITVPLTDAAASASIVEGREAHVRSARSGGAGDVDASRGRLLDHLTGPKGCTRLLRLYLSHNRLVNLLDTDIPRLVSLRELFLANNEINDLASTLRALRRLHTLTCLDLTGNPVTEDPGYRRQILAALPQLQVLDRLAVQPEERQAAMDAAAACAGEPGTTRRKAATSRRPCAETVGSASEVAAAAAATLPRVPGTRTVHFEATSAGADGAEAGMATSHVAFGSTYTAPAAPPPSSHPRTPWPLSATARQLETRRARYLSRKAHRERAEEAAEAAKLATMEDERLAFHAVWGLSGPSMPLSEQQYKQWSVSMGMAGRASDDTRPTDSGSSTGARSPVAAAAAAGGSGTSNGTASRAGAQAAGGRRRSSARLSSSQGGPAASAASTAGVTARVGGELMSPDTVKRLLPKLPTRTPSAPSPAGTTRTKTASVPSRVQTSASTAPPPASVMQESRLYDALLGRSDAVEEKSSRLRTDWATDALPPAGRLQIMRTAVAASKKLLQRHVGLTADGRAAGRSPVGTATPSQSVSPTSSRPSSAASASGTGAADAPRVAAHSPPGASNRELMTLVAAEESAEENAEAARLLTRIQMAKVAMVPRPWENAPAKTTLALMTTDLQQQALKLLHVLLLPQELQMLETQFNGLSEVLLVLKNTSSGLPTASGGAVTFSADFLPVPNATTAPSAGGKTARSASDVAAGAAGSGGTATGTGKRKGAGRGNTVNLVTASDALLNNGTLWRLMTTPLLVQMGLHSSGRRRSANGPPNVSAGRLNSVVRTVSAHGTAPSPASMAAAAAAAATVSAGGGGGVGQSFVSVASANGVTASGGAGGSGLPAGTIGPYAEESVETLLSTFIRETGAWDLDAEALLCAMAELHHVDLTTGEPLLTAEEEAALVAQQGAGTSHTTPGAGAGSSPSLPRTTTAGQAVGPEETPQSRPVKGKKNGSLRNTAGGGGGEATKAAKKGASASSPVADGTGRRSSQGSLVGPPAGGQATGAAAVAATNAPARRRAAYLTVNNALFALVYYLPFVTARVRFFQAQSREGVEARVTAQTIRETGLGGVTGGAAEWFSRAQQAERHRRALHSFFTSRFRETTTTSSAPSASVSPEVLAARTIPSPEQLGTRQVSQVGSFFAPCGVSF